VVNFVASSVLLWYNFIKTAAKNAQRKREVIKLDKKTYIEELIAALEKDYPAAECSLVYEKAYELLFATRLAAQCTDERVNKITPALFEEFPSLEAFAEADLSRVEELVRSCGFYRTKARDIVLAAQMLLREFGGRVPDTMEDLLRLPGVGRKTANLILGDVYGKPAVVVDTHCIRLSNRLGLVSTKDPEKIETALRALLPPEKSNDFCHRLVLHGRAVCSARSPRCGLCSLNGICPKIV
jgi:endonuclease-3